jgi:hypothetical protein
MHGLILSSISLAGNFHQSESLNLIFYLPSPFYHFTILLPITYVWTEFGPRGAWAQGGMRYRNDYFQF